MAEPAAGDIALACCLLLVDELARTGVQTVCISPGSRSTPLALAFARHGAFALHVHLDERSSAYVALGLAKASRRPVALVCTSGTAGANYLPAVVESAQARVPLVVLTADRPPDLRGTGANQTIDQAGLYRGYPRWSADVGVPTAVPGAAAAWRSLGARAAQAALGPPAGPVHLNLAFGEPLVPTGATVELGDDAGGSPRSRAPVGRRAPDEQAVAALAEAIGATERGVVVAGGLDRPAPAVAALAGRLGWPLLAEPTSGLRVPGAALAAGVALVGDEAFAAQQAAELVLQVGATPTSRATLGYVAACGRLVTVDPDGWRADPARHAGRVVPSDPELLATALAARVPARGETPWRGRWAAADAATRAALDALLDEDEEPFEPRVARDVARALPEGATLVVGSSTPVRDLDLAMAPRSGLRVLANRGASGIDGLVSTVLGVALAGPPTYALIGDLSLLHDAGGLLWAARQAGPVTFVVVHNGGGGIFDLLPPAGLPEHEALFVTPHQVDLRALASAAGVGWRRVARAGDLAAVLAAPTPGARLVEVPVARAHAVRHRAELRAAVREALAELPAP